MRCRPTLIEPPVEPAQPPISITATSVSDVNTVQSTKFALP